MNYYVQCVDDKMFDLFNITFGLLFNVIFFGVFITVIFKIVKGSSSTNKSNTYQDSSVTQSNRQGSKYQTINSHYSQQTLNGNAGQSASTIDKNGMPIQPVYNGTFRTDYRENDDHNHAYDHKVEPIEEATVHELFEERKQAYRERKAEMKADLPKTSYSEIEDKVKKSSSKYRDVQGVFAKNGDNETMVAGNEVLINCQYCGAKNIVPRSRSVAYKCYFCRQEV